LISIPDHVNRYEPPFNQSKDSNMRLFGSIFLFALACTAVHAQQTTGAIRGVITDPSGARVADVTITATNTDTGATQTTKSGSGGNYVLPLLPPGRYDVTAESPGFAKALRNGVLIRITETEVVDFSLQLGSVTTLSNARIVQLALKLEF
jgi:hypothetical protein